jgi:beta-1,2-mannobiose phosphorylase / 1,2-beta-oligomannan phosphorylase
MLHRPMWDLSWVRPDAGVPLPATITDPRPGFWVSFVPVDEVAGDVRRLPRFTRHFLIALSEQPWEELKIGGGTPPVRVPEGWLSVYHGVAGELVPGEDLQPHVRYAAGLLVLDPDDITKIVHRPMPPLLEPETDEERDGIVPNVVFPTAIDLRDDDRIDVYYGMADSRIGVARLLRTPAQTPAPHARTSERPAR